MFGSSEIYIITLQWAKYDQNSLEGAIKHWVNYFHPPILLYRMSCLMTKPTKWHVRPAKTQISLSIRPVWSESSLCTQWVVKRPMFLHADSEDSDQTGQMPRLIWVFAGYTCHFAGFAVRRLECSWLSNSLGNCFTVFTSEVIVWRFLFLKIVVHVLLIRKLHFEKEYP